MNRKYLLLLPATLVFGMMGAFMSMYNEYTLHVVGFASVMGLALAVGIERMEWQ